MEDTLRVEKVPIQRINPRIALFYAKPKMGKTKLLSTLKECLTLATEDGVEMYDMIYYRVTSTEGLTTYYKEGPLKDKVQTISMEGVYNLFVKEAERQKAAGQQLKPPYKYIAIDTIDALEDQCEVSATRKYRNTTIGKSFDGTSVLDLSKGGGYYHLRNEVLYWIDRIASICKHLILISHVKDKILDKAGVEVFSTDISLTGKLGSIVAAKADVIGYLYREPGKNEVWVSFQTFDNSSTMGSRFERLAGQRMPFDWDKIYIPEP